MLNQRFDTLVFALVFIYCFRYEIFKGLLAAFDEERRRFRAKLREQELLMQVG